MEYTVVLIVHLLCAIIFLGFVFADLFILPSMKKVLDEQEYQKVMGVISARAKMFFPLSLLVLILSGGYMFAKYINFELGIFNSSLQLLLVLKVLLALAIAFGVVYSLVSKLFKKTPHSIMKHFHKFVLVSGLLIVILAKSMFVV
ncbi:MAG: hypothetical protein KA055_00630 [Aliarcobacter sp.]|nr:hypothetical protein [Aliarcobacter sp.]